VAQRKDHITEQIAAEGFTSSVEEPIDRDYVYIAEKIADRPIRFHPAEDKYEHRGEEGVIAMARLHVYWHVVEELDSWPQIARHLHMTDGVVDALGLDSPRSRETIRLSWKHQFDGAHGRFRRMAEDIREGIGWGRDGVLMAMGVDDGSQSYPEFTAEGVREAAKDRAYDRIRPILTDVVDFDRADNVSVPSEDLTDYAGWLARRREMSPESMDSYVAEMDDLEDRPFDPETYRRAVRNKERERVVVDGEVHWVKPRAFVDETTPNPDVYDSWNDLAADGVDWSIDLLDDPGGTDDWHSTTEEGIERFVAELTEDGIIDGPVPVCIDGSIRSWHKHPQGSDDRPDGVYRESYFDTNYGWKDLSANAIIDGRSVVLANVSSVPGDKFFRAVKYLIDRATDLVDVECFFADAEFSNVDICRYIQHIGEDYIMRKSHRKPVKRLFETFSGTADWEKNYEMNSKRKGMTHKTTLFAVEKRGQTGVKRGEKRHDDHEQAGFDDFDFDQAEGQFTWGDLAPDDDVEYVAFITNKEVDSAGIHPELTPEDRRDETTVWSLAEQYRQRWSIETTFRQIKHQFLPRTRSRDLGTRRFVWMLAILLYNAWATINLFVQSWAAQTFDEDDTDPPVRGKVMLEEIAKTDYG
jgi:IS4 transposase